MDDDTYQYNVRNNQSDMRQDVDIAKRRLGVCVQCKEECDCGVNEYCAVDYNKQIPNWSLIKPENMGFGLTAIQKKALEVRKMNGCTYFPFDSLSFVPILFPPNSYCRVRMGIRHVNRLKARN
jgi:hypothetical protein